MSGVYSRAASDRKQHLLASGGTYENVVRWTGYKPDPQAVERQNGHAKNSIINVHEANVGWRL